jgi:hypothetical protein
MKHHAKVRRTRRSLLKAAAITIGSIAAASAGGRRAAADHDRGRGGGHSYGHPCFQRGTGIRTVDGFRPIETLSPGDIVRTRFGTTAPVKWISSYTLHRNASDGSWSSASQPILVRRGAFRDGAPRVDLHLTAAHAVFLEGVLIPVGNLVNGTTIVLDGADRDEIDFFHVELERHDVIDAEGAQCESYRAPGAIPCAPLLTFNGGRDELKSRLRSAASVLVDRRQPIDVIRDTLEERGFLMQVAAASAPTLASPG